MDLKIAFEHRAQVEEFQRKHRIGLLTLLFTDIVGSTRLKQTLGDSEGFANIQAHHALVRKILADFAEGEEIGTAGDSFFIVFAKPSEAIKFALRLQARLRDLAQQSGTPVFDRVGIHIGEVIIEDRAGAGKPKDLYGIQVDICARVMSLADGDQILMTRSAFDSARQVLKGQALPGLQELVWLNHGAYLLQGVDDPLEILEVGESGRARLRAPLDSEKVHRQVSAPAPSRSSSDPAKTRASRWAIAAGVLVIAVVCIFAFFKTHNASESAGNHPSGRPGTILATIGFESAEGYAPGRSLIGQQGWVRGNWPDQLPSGGQGIATGLMPGSPQQAFIGGVPGQTNPAVHASLSYPLIFTGTPGNGTLELTWKQIVTDSTNSARNLFAWLFYNQAGQMLGGIVFDNSTLKIMRRRADNSVADTGLSFPRGQPMNVKVSLDLQNNTWSAIVGTNALPLQPIALDKRPLNLGSIALTWRSIIGQAPYPGGPAAGDNLLAFDDFIAVSSPAEPARQTDSR